MKNFITLLFLLVAFNMDAQVVNAPEQDIDLPPVELNDGTDNDWARDRAAQREAARSEFDDICPPDQYDSEPGPKYRERTPKYYNGRGSRLMRPTYRSGRVFRRMGGPRRGYNPYADFETNRRYMQREFYKRSRGLK